MRLSSSPIGRKLRRCGSPDIETKSIRGTLDLAVTTCPGVSGNDFKERRRESTPGTRPSSRLPCCRSFLSTDCPGCFSSFRCKLTGRLRVLLSGFFSTFWIGTTSTRCSDCSSRVSLVKLGSRKAFLIGGHASTSASLPLSRHASAGTIMESWTGECNLSRMGKVVFSMERECVSVPLLSRILGDLLTNVEMNGPSIRTRGCRLADVFALLAEGRAQPFATAASVSGDDRKKSSRWVSWYDSATLRLVLVTSFSESDAGSLGTSSKSELKLPSECGRGAFTVVASVLVTGRSDTSRACRTVF
jgi:hypothetical protein